MRSAIRRRGGLSWPWVELQLLELLVMVVDQLPG